MAVEWGQDTVKRAGALYCDFPENIVVIPQLNGRHDPTDIEALAADIAKNDQHTPVGLRKNDDGQPVLVYGHRRWEAVLLLNKRNPSAKRKLIGTYLQVDDTEAFIAAISENRFRKDVSPMDDCANINTLRKRFKYSDEDIAKIYFPEAKEKDQLANALRFVRQRGSLAELAPEAATAVREGKLKVTTATKLAKLTKNLQREKLAEQAAEKLKAKDVPAPKAKPAKPAPDIMKLVKKVLKDVTLERLEDDDFPQIDVNREALLALWQAVYPN